MQILEHSGVDRKDSEEIYRLNKELTFLNTLTLTVISETSLQEACNSAVRQICSETEADITAIFLYKDKLLDLKSYTARNGDKDEYFTFLSSMSPEADTPVYSKNTPEDIAKYEKINIHSFTLLPLYSNNNLTGTLFIASREERDFSRRADFMEKVAQHLSVITDKFLLLEASCNYAEKLTHTFREDTEETLNYREEQLKKQNDALLSLMLAGNLFKLNFKRAISKITEACSDMLGTERVSIWLYNEDYSSVHCIDLFERSKQLHCEGEELRSADFPEYTKLHLTGKPVAAADARTDRRTYEIPEDYYKKHNIYSLLDTPVWLHDKVGGILSFEHISECRQWSGEDERVATAMAAIISLCFEVNERKKAEEERSCLIEIIESTSELIATATPDGVISYMNSAGRKLLGWSQSEDLSLHNISENHPPWALRLLKEEGIPCACEKGIWQGEIALLTSDGREIPVFQTLMSHRSSGGKIRYLSTIMTDITERKKSEKIVRESELFLKETQNIARLGGWKANPYTDYLEWTEGLYHIIEEPVCYRPAMLEGSKYYVPEYLPLIYENITKCLKTGEPFTMEAEMVTAGGKKIWVEVRGISSVIEGEHSYAIGTVQDITERKLAEEALKESEEKFRSIFDFAPCSITITDMEGRYMDVNARFCERNEVKKSNVLGHKHTDFYHTYQQAHTNQIVSMEKKIKSSGYFENEEIELERKTDGTKVILLISSRIINISGLPCILSLCEDITERKKLEEQLRQSQKMEAIGQLAGGVAHDFNNLIQVILGYTSIVMEDLDSESPNYKDLNEVYQAGTRAASLTKQLLAFSRRQILQVSSLNMNDVVSELTNMLQRLIGEHIELLVKKEQNLPAINGDRHQIEQVLINLCVNARDAMPDGGTLTIEIKNLIFDSDYCSINQWARVGQYVMTSVTDTGCGMDKDTVKQIFEPFFTTKEKGRGTGLGLATVYGIVRQHQGIINVYSEPGYGSTFNIYLPVSEDTITEAEETAYIPTGDGGETILLAEDEEQIRRMGKRILEERGYRVITASDGEEALNMYNNYKDDINLLFLDVIMPKKSGKAVYDRIREANPSIKCLFTSGYSDTAVHKNFILDQGLKLIQKPYQKDLLLGMVRQLLDEKIEKVKKTVMIAEDEEPLRDIAVLYIKSMGLEAISASEGLKALELFRKHSDEIGCVLLDLQMPGMDGLTVLRDMKKICSDVKVVITSGYSEAGDIKKVQADGIAGFLQKPYSRQEFREHIKRALSLPE
ncbi:MAG: response regulator [Candidatus Eremiobacterota bacterium]